MLVYFLAAGVFILCISADILFYILFPGNEEEFSPNLRTWALGMLFGIAILLLYRISPLLEKLVDFKPCSYPGSQITWYISTLVFLLVLIGIFLVAAVKISRDES